jgi:2-iminobutanoate/2-iminopropanoate deaminase
MKYSINAPNAPEPSGPYSQGTTAGRLIFTSGQLPLDPNDAHRIIEGGIQDQTERVIQIIIDLLSEVSCTLADVAKTTVYLSSLDDLAAFDEVYERYFPVPSPSRSVVEVCALPMGSLVEMDCIACR